MTDKEKTEQNKNLFYKKADKFLLKIGDENDNYFTPDFSGVNNNWNWLKIFSENIIEDMSIEKRKKTLDNNNRHLKEIKYYINRYIFEDNDNSTSTIKIDDNSNMIVYQYVYNYLKNILEQGFLNKINDNKKEITSIKLTQKDNIDKFINFKIIKEETTDELSVNKKKLDKLNNELNNFNYNYKEGEKNNFIDINFSENNYIYALKDKDINLLDINNSEYKDFLINKENITSSSKLNINLNMGISIKRRLKDLFLSIKNRYNIIQKITGDINVYQEYMTRGVFFYYKTILDELVKKLINKENIEQEDYKYLPISISIMIYDIIFKNIYNGMTDNEVINFKQLNDGQNDMSKFATLFYVEMKPFLDQYKACDNKQKVKFFCNINDNEGAIDKYNLDNDIIKENIKNKIPIKDNLKIKRVFSIKEQLQNDDNNYDTLTINTDTLDKNKKGCESFEIYFNKVFDKTKPQVMAPYIAASNVINNYEGLMLFTFGYSGVGKSFTIFGSNDTPGVLSSIFSSIQNVNNVTIKIYEIYGMGLNKKENFNDNVYNKYVNHKIKSNNNNFEIDESNMVDNIKEVQGTPIDVKNLQFFLKQLNSINNTIEELRGKINNDGKSNYSIGGLNDNKINIKTIKKTKNNPDSSRSILCYELIINKDEQKIPFIIVDLPGKEIIKDSFGEEGKALLKINPKNVNKEEEITIKEIDFLQENFSNILSNIEKINSDELDNMFEDIKINKETIPVLIYKKEKNKIDIIEPNISIPMKNIPFIFDNENVEEEKKFFEIIKFIPNFLRISQYHVGFKKSGSSLNNKLIYGTETNKIFNIFLNISDDYSKKFEISNESKNITKGIKFRFNMKTYKEKQKQPYLNINEHISKFPLGFNNENYAQILSKQEIYFGINEKDLNDIHKIALKSFNKLRLIKLFKNAIYYSSQQSLQAHPILKLTQILDKINDKDYINNYENYAEKCFRYTKSAEGIFINENINGIMQLMINKKGTGTNMKKIQTDYNESEMFYNQIPEGINSIFNNTLIYDNLYTQYEGNNDLRKIDNMYAFFVVANISKNQRIKQKLICNATKTNEGYRRDLGWECDEKALAIERKTKKEEANRADEIAKKTAEDAAANEVNTIINILNENPQIILKAKKIPSKLVNKYFENNKDKAKAAEIFLINFNKNNKINTFSKDKEKLEYISKLANAIVTKNMSGGGDDRSLYIEEMCKTQIALFRELKSIINGIVKPE